MCHVFDRNRAVYGMIRVFGELSMPCRYVSVEKIANKVAENRKTFCDRQQYRTILEILRVVENFVIFYTSVGNGIVEMLKAPSLLRRTKITWISSDTPFIHLEFANVCTNLLCTLIIVRLFCSRRIAPFTRMVFTKLKPKCIVLKNHEFSSRSTV